MSLDTPPKSPPRCPRCGTAFTPELIGQWSDPVWEPGRTAPFIGGPVYDGQCGSCGAVLRAYGNEGEAPADLTWETADVPESGR